MAKNLMKMTLTRRIRYLVIFSVVLTGVIGSSITYVFHLQSLQKEYYETNRDAAEDAAKLVYTEDAVELSDMIHDKGFQKVRAKAVETGDYSIVETWIKENDYEDTYRDTALFLDDLRYVIGVGDLFLVSCDESGLYVLAYAGMDYSDPGAEMPKEIWLNDYKTTDQTDPIEVHLGDQYGIFCRSFHRLKGNVGTRNLFVGVDTDLSGYAKRERAFLINLIITYLLIILAMSLVGIYFAKKHLTTPLNQIKDAALGFAKQHKNAEISEAKDPGVHTNDELEELNDSILYLEESVLAEQKELEQINRKKGRIDAELSIAREIQKGVLPDHFPEDADLNITDIYAYNDPAREVGGDFYDFFRTDDNHMVFVIGDVSDKGIPAALFMMVSKLLIKECAMKSLHPEEVLQEVNERLFSLNRAEMFVTIWIGILDLETGMLRTSNGGHEYPIFRFGKEPFEYYRDHHGMAVAGMPHSKYKAHEIQMNPGDAFVVYSDGAVDARDSTGEGYGSSHLLESVNHAKASNAKDLVLSVKKDIETYSGNTEQFDDITILAVIYQPEAASGSTEADDKSTEA